MKYTKSSYTKYSKDFFYGQDLHGPSYLSKADPRFKIYASYINLKLILPVICQNKGGQSHSHKPNTRELQIEKISFTIKFLIALCNISTTITMPQSRASCIWLYESSITVHVAPFKFCATSMK